MTRYRLVSDDDGHDYLIPAERWNEWSAWVEAGYFDGDSPLWAIRLGSSLEGVTFERPEVNGRILE